MLALLAVIVAAMLVVLLTIGQRLLQRIEKRAGITFERKAVQGKRLILCPPKIFEPSAYSHDAREVLPW
jgi:hypothetical protein